VAGVAAWQWLGRAGSKGSAVGGVCFAPMSEPLIRVERDGDIAVLTFDDPERLNAMTEAMGHALNDASAALRREEGLRAVVLTGAGRAFSAGGDLEMIRAKAELAAGRPGEPVRTENREFMGRFYRLYLSVRDIPVPTLAAIHGPAIGAGFCVALGCDIRVAATEAKLGLNFTRLGIHPGMGATWALPRLVGPALAAELLFTGRILGGEEAARIGLVNRAVPKEEVLETTLGLAREIAASGPLAVRGTKEALARSLTSSLDEQLDFEAAQQSLNYETADLAEGIRAVREKRAPRFEDR
jgi:enoyl-CoA hydratase